MSESLLEVWLDCDLCPMQRLGTLAHDRGQVRFHYDKTWLTQQDIAFAFYRLTSKRARELIDEVVNVVADWKIIARRAKIAAADIELSASAFAALEH